MFRKLFRKLFPKKTPIDFLGGYILNKFFMDRVDKGPVLIIGDTNGRDFYPINNHFKNVYLLDVSDNNLADKDHFIQQSIEEKTRFNNNFFKYVIMSNVIEHIWEDKRALEEIRRILDDDGQLLFCVPLYHDFHDQHYHIYSPNTVNLLFKHSGYQIKESRFMGTFTSMPYEISAILALILYPFFQENSLQKINKLFYKFHELICHSVFINKVFNFRIRKRFFSILVHAKKSKNKINSIEIQRKHYEYN